jgi:hypothetical protein
VAAALLMMLPAQASAVSTVRTPKATVLGWSAPADQPTHAKRGGCAFDQNDPLGDTGIAINSQHYEPTYQIYDDMAADDFVCAKSIKRVKRIDVTGSYYDGIGPARTMDVRVLANDRSGGVDEPSDGEPVCVFPDRQVPPIGDYKFVFAPRPLPRDNGNAPSDQRWTPRSDHAQLCTRCGCGRGGERPVRPAGTGRPAGTPFGAA